MTDGTTDTASDSERVQTDGGVAAQEERATDYLNTEINLLNPSTPFMRDHLRVVWLGFVIWFVVVFAPPTLTFVAPGAMSTQIPVLGFPLHYFLIAIGGPTGALILSYWYSRKRDALDEKYGIDHATGEEVGGGEDVAATDGGAER